MIHTIVRSYLVCVKLLAVIAESYQRATNAQGGWCICLVNSRLLCLSHLELSLKYYDTNRFAREGGVDSFTVLIEDSQLIKFSKNVQVTPYQSNM